MTDKWILTLFAFSPLWCQSSHSAEPQFREHVIDSVGSKLGQTALVDIDRDGDLDYVCGEADHSGTSRPWWWEFRAADRWIRHDIGKTHTDVGGAAHDVNGDGWPDILSGSKLFLNSGSPKTKGFSLHEPGTIYSHDTEFGDIDGDGRLDALANSDKSGLYWYAIPKDATKPWKQYLVASIEAHKIHGGVSPKAVGDIDGDGDNDIVTGQGWFENSDAGVAWKLHKNIDFGVAHQYGVAVRTWVGDLDEDGDCDVIQSEADNPFSRVAWFENDGKGDWTRHLIRGKTRQDFHSLAVADFDNDGDLDVFSGGGPMTGEKYFKCYVWENMAGKTGKPTRDKWAEHLVAQKHCHEAVAGDVDADGDIDIVFKPWSGEIEHIFLENTLITRKPTQP